MPLSILDIAYRKVDQLETDRLASSKDASNSLVVRSETPALDVANQIATQDADLILVSNNRGNIEGVVVPSWVQDQVNLMLGEAPPSFYDAVLVLENDYKRSQSRAMARREFHHEWLNEARPRLYWCEKGRHFIAAPPCLQH